MYQKSEKYNIKKTENISKKYAEILSEIGEDTSREGLEKTPIRCAKAIQFLTQGYHANPDKILKSALFHEEYNQMVLIKNIELYMSTYAPVVIKMDSKKFIPKNSKKKKYKIVGSTKFLSQSKKK